MLHDSTPAGTSLATDPTKQELKAGDRVEALGNFSKPMGTFGTVEAVEEYSVVVLWDGAGPMTLGPSWIRKAIS
jgi:hypothetical protein